MSAPDPLAQARLRRATVCAALEDGGFEVLVVGRPSNLAFLTGGRRVVVRGSRPFSPVAVLVVGSGELHVQTYSPEADRIFGGGDASYPQSWDPRRVADSLAGIDALARARRIAVDGMTPDWEARLGAVAPNTVLADAEPVLRSLRTTRTQEEIASLRRSLAVARAAMEAAVAVVRPGAEARHVRAAAAGTALAFEGASLVHEGWCRRARDDGAGRLVQLPTGAAMASGDLVALDVAVVVDGYETGAGRTVRCGPDGTAARGSAPWARVRDAVRGTCRAGATGAQLTQAAASAGWDAGPLPLSYPLGFGPEPPLAASDAIDDSTVLAVQGVVSDESGRACYGRDLLLVGADGAEILTPW